MLVETNLTNCIEDKELGLDNYNIFTRDRYKLGGITKGGGILIAVEQNLLRIVIFNEYTTPCKQLFIQLKTGEKNLIIGAVYIPPASPSETFICHVNTVKTLFQTYLNGNELSIIGDYNLPKTHWINSSDSDESLDIICYHEINLVKNNSTIPINSFLYLNLRQLIDVHDKKG